MSLACDVLSGTIAGAGFEASLHEALLSFALLSRRLRGNIMELVCEHLPLCFIYSFNDRIHRIYLYWYTCFWNIILIGAHDELEHVSRNADDCYFLIVHS